MQTFVCGTAGEATNAGTLPGICQQPPVLYPQISHIKVLFFLSVFICFAICYTYSRHSALIHSFIKTDSRTDVVPPLHTAATNVFMQVAAGRNRLISCKKYAEKAVMMLNSKQKIKNLQKTVSKYLKMCLAN